VSSISQLLMPNPQGSEAPFSAFQNHDLIKLIFHSYCSISQVLSPKCRYSSKHGIGFQYENLELSIEVQMKCG
jgi:hypothetical protein